MIFVIVLVIVIVFMEVKFVCVRFGVPACDVFLCVSACVDDDHSSIFIFIIIFTIIVITTITRKESRHFLEI